MRFIIGKLYMETCPHCIPLIPIWKSLQEQIDRKNQEENLGLDIVYIDEEAENIDSKLEKHNHQYFNGEKKIQVQMGYPTIFFGIPEKKVDYYEGDRSLDALESWYMDKMGLQKKIENSSVSSYVSPSSSTIESGPSSPSSPSSSFIEKLLSRQEGGPVPSENKQYKKKTRKRKQHRTRSSRSRKNRRSLKKKNIKN